MNWPRKNDAESIQARRDAIRGTVGDAPLAHDDEAWTRAQESHTGATLIPVSVVGPLVVELGQYELRGAGGNAPRDRARRRRRSSSRSRTPKAGSRPRCRAG